MIHMPNASAVMSGVSGTLTPLFGVGSRRVRSSRLVFRPMWQQMGRPVSSINENSGA